MSRTIRRKNYEDTASRLDVAAHHNPKNPKSK
jgi:hypothetical protein